jgi:hypothetical protein
MAAITGTFCAAVPPAHVARIMAATNDNFNVPTLDMIGSILRK